MSSVEPKLMLVCTDCENTRILYNGLKDELPFARIIAEQPVSRGMLIKRRIRKLGWFRVMGQLIFQVLISPLVRKASAKRIREILRKYNLNNEPLPGQRLVRIASVNQPEFLNEVKKEKPDLILVNGTRIIARRVLEQIDCPVINVHVGITPLYRGVHGAYWALAQNDRENCGVTIHAVDSGIDTGGIIAQECVKPTAKDNFITYPYLQFERAIAILKRVIPDILQNGIKTVPAPRGNSKLWYHPTVWQYLRHRLRGVK